MGTSVELYCGISTPRYPGQSGGWGWTKASFNYSQMGVEYRVYFKDPKTGEETILSSRLMDVVEVKAFAKALLGSVE